MARVTRIALDIALATSKALKPAVSTAWQYAKIEIVPPFTIGFFSGPAGRKIEDFTSKTTDGFISNLQKIIHEMDAEKERQIRLKEEAIRAEQEKVKTEAKIAKEKAIQKAKQRKPVVKVEQVEVSSKKEEPKTTPSKPKGRNKGSKVKDKRKPKQAGRK